MPKQLILSRFFPIVVLPSTLYETSRGTGGKRTPAIFNVIDSDLSDIGRWSLGYHSAESVYLRDSPPSEESARERFGSLPSSNSTYLQQKLFSRTEFCVQNARAQPLDDTCNDESPSE